MKSLCDSNGYPNIGSLHVNVHSFITLFNEAVWVEFEKLIE